MMRALLAFIAFLFFSALTQFSISQVHAHETRLAPRVVILIAEQKDEREQILPLQPYAQQVLNYLEVSLQVKFEIRRYPWRRVLHNGENGEGLIFSIYKTPEREKRFMFSEPVYSEKIWLVKRCSDPFNFSKIEDLSGKTIGIVKGSSAGEAFDKEVNVLFRPEYNDSNLSGRFSKLYQRRMDAFLLYEPRTNLKALQHEINHRFAADIEEYKRTQQEIFCILPKPISTVDVHFAQKKNAPTQLLERINAILRQAQKKGALERILKR